MGCVLGTILLAVVRKMCCVGKTQEPRGILRTGARWDPWELEGEETTGAHWKIALTGVADQGRVRCGEGDFEEESQMSALASSVDSETHLLRGGILEGR